MQEPSGARDPEPSLTSNQPLATTTIRRPFHWGIVTVGPDGSGQLPDVAAGALVSANAHGLVILVRHAQDIESFGADFDWAEAEIVVRQLVNAESAPRPRREVFRGLINVPNGRLAVGDADGFVVVPAHEGANIVVVTVDASLPVDGPITGASWLGPSSGLIEAQDRRASSPRVGGHWRTLTDDGVMTPPRVAFGLGVSLATPVRCESYDA